MALVSKSPARLAVALSLAALAASEGDALNAALKPTEATRRYHVAPMGSDSCDSSTIGASEDTCFEAVQELLPADVEQGRTELVVGDFADAPPGCSMKTGDDWSAVYNTNDEGSNDGGYSPVCVGAGRRAGVCSLPRVAELDAEKFELDYRSAKRAVIVTGGAFAWFEDGLEPWSTEGFSKTFGQIHVPLRDPEAVKVLGKAAPLLEGNQTIEEYLAAMALGEEPIPVSEEGWQEPVVREVRSALNPRSLKGVSTLRGQPSLQFGGEGTGVSWQTGDEMWFGQVQGVTRWFVNPPTTENQKMDFRFDVCSLLDYPPLAFDIVHCDTQPGDIIYFPADWWRASCNLKQWNLVSGGREDVGGLTAAHRAALDGDAKELSAVASEQGVKALSAPVGKSSLSPAHLAAKAGNVASLEALKNLGGDVLAENGNSSTPLLVAAQVGHLPVLEWYRNNGFNVSTADKRESTALHKAARNGHTEMVRWLLRHLPTGTAFAIDKRKQTVLHAACTGGHLEIVQMLAKEPGFEAAKEMRDRRGQTPLDLAVQVKAFDIGRALGAEYMAGEDELEQPRNRPNLDEDEEEDEEFEGGFQQVETHVGGEPSAPSHGAEL